MSTEIASITPHINTTQLDLPHTHAMNLKTPQQVSSIDRSKSEHTKDEESHLKEQDLQALTKELNEKMKRMESNLTFSYNEVLRSLVVTIKDSNGDRIIREIPSKEAIKLTEKMRDILGIIFDKKG
ncbi:FlaG family protein [Helicobacter heilmannii]|uniref:Possible flagellar protein n=1 Tax=Helicobacter heilmannii TaxID=35817 RepID=A0A0K2YAA7_HELHE|nr:FlaG family protein [Helicobacter heilmannii]CCM11771.1 flagellar protein FlaG [Helicobacter heilmannii ASB1.4]CRF45992.1 Possible flagellar protein [Helicobacter heilmannii]CRF46972.1 Possible flagellar protein [Helicobacter heilmannii]CRF49728.1 Possible flagellar protein [Helicobacter heilmannii]CRF51737.1 Possible flagellar protein [Helicobacter heilmannii]